MGPKTESKQKSQKRTSAARRAKAHSLTRRAHGSELAEDYVEAIAELIELNGEARAVDIAKHFGVTHVTVIKTVARLQRDGLVTTKPYRSIFLTKIGQDLADRCRDRHQVIVSFLEAVGVSHETAIHDSEGIEHHVSPETLQAFRAFLKQNQK